MPEFVDEFQDFITCRRETLETLLSRYSLSPLPPELLTYYKIRVKNRYHYFNRDEIKRVLKIWRGASEVPSGEGHHIHCHKILVKELQKKSY